MQRCLAGAAIAALLLTATPAARHAIAVFNPSYTMPLDGFTR
jgi:hypothetical protein